MEKNRKNPLISVVTPTFNRARTLPRAIDSVLSQTFVDWELIIVDNHSSDNSKELVSSYNSEKIKFFQIQNNGNIAKSRNLGIDNARGEFIAFLDSDDYWEPSKLARFLLRAENSYNAVYYHNCYIEKNSSRKKIRCRLLRENALNDLVENGNTLVASSVIIPKSVLKEVNFFSEDVFFQGWEDYHLWLKCAEQNITFAFDSEFLGSVTRGDDNFDTPFQVLKNLNNIQQYFHMLTKSGFDYKKIWWIKYSRQSAKHDTKEYKDSVKLGVSVLKGATPYQFKAKSLVRIICSILGFFIASTHIK